MAEEKSAHEVAEEKRRPHRTSSAGSRDRHRTTG
jgi:hypothetical protein